MNNTTNQNTINIRKQQIIPKYYMAYNILKSIIIQKKKNMHYISFSTGDGILKYV